MYDLDTILSVVENPTRRRILQALVREPHYPLQLSRELGVSQPAIMKNLDILEKSGLVESWRESSDRGPDKIVYRPTSSFTLTIDMRNGMFRTSLVTADQDDTVPDDGGMELKEIRRNLSEMDDQIEEFEKLRAEIVRRRNMMINSFMNSASADLDYIRRNMLYEMLNFPNMNISEVSKDLGIREDEAEEMAHEIECVCKDAKEGGKNEQ